MLQLPISLQNLSKNYNIDFTRIYKELLEFTKKYVGKKSWFYKLKAENLILDNFDDSEIIWKWFYIIVL